MVALELGSDGSPGKRPAASAVARALEHWLATGRDTAGARVVDCRDLRGGLENWSYAITVLNAPWRHSEAVIRLRRWPDASGAVDIERSALLWAESRGIAAPRFIDGVAGTDTPLRRPFLIETFVPGASDGQVWFIGRQRRERTFANLAELQARLHATSTLNAGVPLLSIDSGLDELEDVERALGVEDRGALEWMRQYSGTVADDGSRAMLHLDFHPGNVLVHHQEMSLIDWSQARLGDPLADVARTVEVLGLGALVVGVPALWRRITSPTVTDYLDAYSTHHEIDGARLRYWRAYHALVVRAQLRTIADRVRHTNRALSVVARRGAGAMLRRWSQVAISRHPPY